VTVDNGSWGASGVFMMLFAYVVFKAIHKILRFVHEEDIK